MRSRKQSIGATSRCASVASLEDDRSIGRISLGNMGEIYMVVVCIVGEVDGYARREGGCGGSCVDMVEV
jgi:hypothetical protein